VNPVFSGPELCALTACEAVELLRKRDVTPAELLAASKTRHRQVDAAVNAMPTQCFERAGRRAEGIKPQDGEPGWLAGLPIGIKDLTPVKGVRTTWGTKALADFVPAQSAPLVSRLEARDGLVVGKTNTPEMGAGGNTFNAVFGMTRNPWDTRKNAGGSSGGAAVSLATGQVWLSHGSDLAGSLRTPAAYCGVVGMRPTPGRAGGGPAAIAFEGEGISGPMARNVRDCALFLDAMAGFDAREPMTLEPPRVSFQAAARSDPGPIRIAFAPDLNGFSALEPEIGQVMSDALKRAQGPDIKVEDACPQLDGLAKTYTDLRGAFYCAVNDRLSDEVKAHFKPTLKQNIAQGRKVTAQDIYDAQRQRTVIYHAMRVFLDDFDVLACAVVGIEPGPVEVEYPPIVNGVPSGDDYISWLKFSFLATTTQLPALSIPCGFTKSGMPVGIQLIGPPHGDARLLQVARVLEDSWGLADNVPIDPVVRHEQAS